MLLDILIGVPILISIILGVRDGIIRKLVATIALIAGLFLGQIYMHPVGTYLADRGWIEISDAQQDGFLIIFLGLTIIQSLLYKLLTGSYKIGGVADRIGGAVLGFIQGVIFISSLLFIFALSGSPDPETKRDASLYKPIVNIAPQILDITSSLETDPLNGMPSAIESRSGVEEHRKMIDTSSVLKTKKEFNIKKRFQ
jgi:uncharacterized membrane protein required for colicin V production